MVATVTYMQKYNHEGLIIPLTVVIVRTNITKTVFININQNYLNCLHLIVRIITFFKLSSVPSLTNYFKPYGITFHMNGQPTIMDRKKAWNKCRNQFRIQELTIFINLSL
jgi:hypothetical protein